MPLDAPSNDILPEIPKDGPEVPFTEEMARSYGTYALSTLVQRYLPDARDGLKPVHRRILYQMYKSGFTSEKPYKKSARTVGDVMGMLHPHGDSSIYDALVRMAQPFSLRLPLIDGQGNFGSIDGDNAAAMRYTEARLTVATELLLEDIDKQSVDFRPNYDSSEMEPVFLASRIPTLLINGTEGIGVGMATKIAPHHPIEALEAAILYAKNSDVTVDEILAVMPGPDFPTGGRIMGRSGIRQAYDTGRGTITLRGQADIEVIPAKKGKSERRSIVITEIPYQIDKPKMVTEIALLGSPGKDGNGKPIPPQVPGIDEVRDESNKDGIRIVVDLEKDADASAVLNSLYRRTNLQISFGFNMNAAIWVASGGYFEPGLLNMRGLLAQFIEHRRDVIGRRARFDLGKAREKMHDQVGMAAALSELDRVISIIRASKNKAEARQNLMTLPVPCTGLVGEVVELDPESIVIRDDLLTPVLNLTEDQANAILNMQLSRLTGLDQEQVAEETRRLAAQIADCLEILNNPVRAQEVLLAELEDAKARIPAQISLRRTIIDEALPERIEDLATTPREPVLISLTDRGYIKRTPVKDFRSQRRGGVGKTGADTRDDEIIQLTIQATTHADLIFFTEAGMAYSVAVRQLPPAGPRDRGRPVVNFCEPLKGQKISAILALEPDADSGDRLIFVTSAGTVRCNAASDFEHIMSNGKIAMRFEGDHHDTRLVSVLPARADEDLSLVTADGMTTRFPVSNLRVFNSRQSTGVAGIDLRNGDVVIGAAVLPHGTATIEERDLWISKDVASLTEEKFAELKETERFLLTVSRNGFGKLTSTHAYRVINRGGRGVSAHKISDKTGPLVAALQMTNPAAHDLIITTQGGMVIRIPADQVSRQGRDTRGVKLMAIADDPILNILLVEAQPKEVPEESSASASAAAPVSDQAPGACAESPSKETSAATAEDQALASPMDSGIAENESDARDHGPAVPSEDQGGTLAADLPGSTPNEAL